MAKVFISYARKDKDKVYPIVDMLEKNGIDCWIDKDGIESGDEFENVIIRAINKSDIFLYMLSPNAIKSDWVKDEFEHAKHKGKTIIPICFSKLFDNEDDLDTAMFRFRRIDYVDTAIEGWQEKLLRAVIKYSGDKESSEAKDEHLNDTIEKEPKSSIQNTLESSDKGLTQNDYGIRPEFMQLIVSIVENYYMSRKSKGKRTRYDIEKGIEQLMKIDTNSLNLEEDDLKTYCIKILTSSIKDTKPYHKEFHTEAYRILYTGEIKNISDLSNYELYGSGVPVTPSQNFNLFKILDDIAQLGTIVPETLINKPVLCPGCHCDIVATNSNKEETLAVRCSNPNCNYFVVTDTPHKSKQTHRYFSLDTKCTCSGGEYRLRHANFSDVFFQCDRCGRKAHPTLLEYANHD